MGLLGGSFNPPHDGHLHISLWTKRCLGVQQIWWIPARSNPLKKPKTPFCERFTKAQKFIQPYKFLKIQDIENRFGLTYTLHTVQIVQRRYPRVRFFWIMGADSFVELPRWFFWQDFTKSICIVVVPRKPWRERFCLAARILQPYTHHNPATFFKARPPAVLFLKIPHHPASSQSLRRTK